MTRALSVVQSLLLANGLLLVTGLRKLFNGAMKTLLRVEKPALSRFPFAEILL